MSTADVVICGGGMVGLSCGLALAKGGLKVLVIDAQKPSAAIDPDFDGRVSALAYSSVRMLAALGVWDGIAPHAQAIHEILVSDGRPAQAASVFSLHFDAGELGRSSLGHIAENRHIRCALYRAAESYENLKFLAPAAAASINPDRKQATVLLKDGRKFSSPLAIAADGRGSRLRPQMGIQTVGWSYPQIGIVTCVTHEKPHNGVAYEHFLPPGPFAILPMTGNRSSLVWTEAEAKAPALLSLDDKAFHDELSLRFGSHLGAIRAVGPRWSYPLSFHLARSYVKPRFALLGDCAHGIHPIAGQGLNLGLKDAAALAETILDAARLGRDIGALDTLRRYERWRRFDSFALAASTDLINRLFSNDNTLLRAVRDLGLGIVDSIAPARRFFMRHAGGDVGKLPRLLKGEAA